MYFIGVSEEFNNKKSRRANPTRDRKRKMAHYYDESFNHFRQKENFVVLFVKEHFYIKWRKRKFVCEECGYVFKGLVKIFKQEVDCPKCL